MAEYDVYPAPSCYLTTSQSTINTLIRPPTYTSPINWHLHRISEFRWQKSGKDGVFWRQALGKYSRVKTIFLKIKSPLTLYLFHSWRKTICLTRSLRRNPVKKLDRARTITQLPLDLGCPPACHTILQLRGEPVLATVLVNHHRLLIHCRITMGSPITTAPRNAEAEVRSLP